MNGETDREREQKAEDLAYERGKESAEISSHLREHDRHLAAINGSVDRVFEKLEALESSQTVKFQEVATGQHNQDLAINGLKIKLAFYAGVGSILGGGIVTAVIGFVAKVSGG
ncbi:MAG: hypothetical protein QOF68_1757 [Gaiellales bacterium]|jgi:hypothetical protein|nr:hypothetical protein [Gaiellales bacterium]